MHDIFTHAGCAIDSIIKEAIDNPVIIHYTSSSKPWHFGNNHPYKYLYWKHLRKTPYKYFIPDDLNIINIIKWMVPLSVKQYLKNIGNIKSK